jgi:hypothetical protein
MSESLSERLRCLRVETLVREAEIIRDHPAGNERLKEANSLIYTVMYQRTLGQLTYAEKEQILGIIDFAREHHAPAQRETAPRINPLD